MATLITRDSLMILRGNPQEIVGELKRRRDRLGISYVTVNALLMEEFAPVVELLAGRGSEGRAAGPVTGRARYRDVRPYIGCATCPNLT
jgi:hypothetical protein